MTQAAATRRVTFRDVLANREFRALYAAQALSITGDQLARIAVAILVFTRSGSAWLTALSYGVSYLPLALGGPLLSGYADRLPRRTVMIRCDLLRALLVLLLVLPHLPLGVLLLLVFAVALLQPPFSAARSSLLPDVVGEGETYAVATTLSLSTANLGVVVGFGLGGVAVATLGVRPSILLDALSFGVSAWLVRRHVRSRPAADTGVHRPWADMRRGFSLVYGDQQLRWLVLMSSLVITAAICTAGIAVPLAAEHGAGAAAAGLLTAGLELGVVVGGLLVGRVLTPTTAERLMLPLALAAPLVLALTAFDPPLWAVGLIWLLGGTASAAQVVANRVFVTSVDRALRGRAFGVATATIAVGQALGLLVCGALADAVTPAVAVADVTLPVFAALVVLSVTSLRSRTSPVRSTQHERPNQDEETMPTTQESPARAQLRVWALNAALVVVACIGALAFRGDHALTSINLPVWWLGLLFLIAVAAPIRFSIRKQVWTVHLSDVPLVLGLFFLAPDTLILLRCLATVVEYGVLHRRPFVKVVFNVAAASASTLMILPIFRGLVSASASAHAASWPAAFAAVLVEGLISGLLVAAVILLSERAIDVRHNAQMLGITAASGALNTLLALTTAAALSYDANTAWAITIFVGSSVAAVRTHKRLSDRHAALDKLYTVARELGPIAAEPRDLVPALHQLRRIVAASQLELALPSDQQGFATVITVSDDASNAVTVIDREIDATTAGALDLSFRQANDPLARLLALLRRPRRAADTIAVPVGSGERPFALLTAVRHDATTQAFDAADYRLLEAAAGQLSAALEKGRLVASLRHAATRDSLTDLANLDSLRSFLNTMLEGNSGGVLLLLDIDRFHEINDTLGHEAGDLVLAQVARRLEESPTHGALAARIGGDQFALALPGQAGAEVARLAALAVKSRVDGPLRLETVSADLRVTIGMARAPEHGNDAATLLRRAEMAMTAAKGSSSGIDEWEPGYERDGSRRLQLLAGLRQALTAGELRVEYQPKIRNRSGAVTGFEALVRWRHPELGAISPDEFVPLAETSGLINALTSNVLRMALTACARWHELGRRVGVAVNVSARNLDDPVLVGQVAAMLTATGVEPRWLTLEITESSVMENASRSIETLLQLRSLGVRLSIDDFGTGYSSLHQLRGLPVHEVKIDKAFVDHVDGDGADRAVVRAIVELCDSLGLTTVAEGVEQAGQAYALDSLGVGQLQGYFYSRPLPEDDATAWLLPRLAPDQQVEPEDVPRG